MAKAMRGEFHKPEIVVPPVPIELPHLPAPSNPRPDRTLLQEIWTQLRGPAGNGWPQLGNKTLIDYVSALSNYAADLDKRISELDAKLDAVKPPRPSKKTPGKKAPAKKAPAKKATAKKKPRVSRLIPRYSMAALTLNRSRCMRMEAGHGGRDVCKPLDSVERLDQPCSKSSNIVTDVRGGSDDKVHAGTRGQSESWPTAWDQCVSDQPFALVCGFEQALRAQRCRQALLTTSAPLGSRRRFR
jgi:hypothetical protein